MKFDSNHISPNSQYTTSKTLFSMKKVRTIINTTLALLVFSGCIASPEALAKSAPSPVQLSQTKTAAGKRLIKATVKINAPPELVWEAIHQERNHDPSVIYTQTFDEKPGEYSLKQKYNLLPGFGTAECVIRNLEIPHKRIDYYLIQGDNFKKMEGSWVLTSMDAGKSTLLELTTYVETVFSIPRFFLDSVTSRKAEKLVASTKRHAESMHQPVVVGNAIPTVPKS